MPPTLGSEAAAVALTAPAPIPTFGCPPGGGGGMEYGVPDPLPVVMTGEVPGVDGF